MIGTRQPTVDEAVDIMKKTITTKQLRGNIAYWREKFGDEFADQVRNRAGEEWKKSNK